MKLHEGFDPDQDSDENHLKRQLPSVNESVLDEPSQFPFWQDRVGHGQASVFPDVRFAQTQRVNEPIVLLVTIVVFSGTKGVSHIFYAIDDGAGEIVRRVNSEITKLFFENILKLLNAST